MTLNKIENRKQKYLVDVKLMSIIRNKTNLLDIAKKKWIIKNNKIKLNPFILLYYHTIIIINTKMLIEIDSN